MTAKLLEFGLRLPCDWVTPTSRSFRPPSWPPPRDWVVSEDADGAVLSRYGDPTWDLSPWAGKKTRLDFGDGPTKRLKKAELDTGNADLLRVIAALLIWGPNGVAAVNSLKSRFLAIRRVVTHCSKHGIRAADLMRFRACDLFDARQSCGAEANMAKYLAAKASWEAANACVQTHGGFGFAEEYDVERKFRETRLYQVAPISTNLILSYVAEHVLGMPRSY